MQIFSKNNKLASRLLESIVASEGERVRLHSVVDADIASELVRFEQQLA